MKFDIYCRVGADDGKPIALMTDLGLHDLTLEEAETIIDKLTHCKWVVQNNGKSWGVSQEEHERSQRPIPALAICGLGVDDE